MAATPVVTGSFVGGAWTGDIRILGVGSDLVLMAKTTRDTRE